MLPASSYEGFIGALEFRSQCCILLFMDNGGQRQGQRGQRQGQRGQRQGQRPCQRNRWRRQTTSLPTPPGPLKLSLFGEIYLKINIQNINIKIT